MPSFFWYRRMLGGAVATAASIIPVALAAQSANAPPPFAGEIRGGGSPLYVRTEQPEMRRLAAARAMVAKGDFAEAAAILQRIAASASADETRMQANFLLGVSQLGLKTPAEARESFRKALPASEIGHPGAMSGLAVAEARLGNADAARAILGKLRQAAEDCGSCGRAPAYVQAQKAVEQELARKL